MAEQELVGHNRWHPDIPAAVVGQSRATVFRIECKDWTDGQIKNNDSPDDVRDVDLSVVHVLSGPIEVNGAKPGDILVVDILDIGCLRGRRVGLHRHLRPQQRRRLPHRPLSRRGQGDLGLQRHLRHVAAHPGRAVCRPDPSRPDRLRPVARAAGQVEQARSRAGRAPIPSACRRWPICRNPKNAVLGSLKGAAFDRVAKEAARTVPPREHGGNCDIKNLSRGSRIYFPVYVDGAKLSMGDIHFSQGDGEISFCGAIEMSGFIDLHVDIIKGGVAKYGMVNPIFKPGPVEPHHSRVPRSSRASRSTRKGKQYYLDAHVAYKRACLNAIEYLKHFGFTGEQAYLLLSCCPCEGRVSGIVDIPNACCTLALPTSIFEKSILPV